MRFNSLCEKDIMIDSGTLGSAKINTTRVAGVNTPTYVISLCLSPFLYTAARIGLASTPATRVSDATKGPRSFGLEKVAATVLPQQSQQQPHAPDHWMQLVMMLKRYHR